MPPVKLATGMSRIGTELAFEAAARARALEAQGRDIVHLEIGEPDFDTPPNIREAAKRALDQGYTHYGPFKGYPELRHAVAADLRARRGLEYDPEQIIIMPGAKPVMYFTILAFCDAEADALYPDPGFPIYESMIRFTGAGAIPVPIRGENSFRIDTDELKALVTRRSRLLILNSPSNPTGGVLTRPDLEAVARIAVEHDLVVLSDEIYSRILYGGEHVSIATFPGMKERTILLDGWSKTYAMTGWRLGYAAVPEPWVMDLARLVINSVSCVSSFSQVAALEALTGPQDAVGDMVSEFQARRDLIVDGLNGIPGISCLKPEGAFYVFPSVAGTGLSGSAFAERLLLETGVSTLSGTAFGTVGKDHVRMSYAASRERIREALDRIGAFVASLPEAEPATA
jgi:aspartate aminotransferase